MNKTEILEIFNNSNPQLLEQLAQEAQKITRQYFGKTMSLYAPLYLSNHCANQCVYCGFHASLDIPRLKLDETEIEQECQALALTGIQSILLLTGESRKHTPPEYLETAIKIAKKYFASIAVEVYPLETAEYARLNAVGCDGVTVFQETYDRERYKILHPAGKKSNYDYRYQAPQRIALGGMRQITLGPLLGLADWRQDVLALYEHLRTLEKEFSGVDYTLSFPRLRQLSDYNDLSYLVSDADLVKIICLTRIIFPRVGINISTRESAEFRDKVVHFGATKISAGSSTQVGGYAPVTERLALSGEVSERSRTVEGSRGVGLRTAQFEINDNRSVSEVKAMLERQGFDPVFTDWRCLEIC
ncbi:2-iminoacetate synthase [Candidatus Termititenax dinenymphae]|uniref:2-iminoacetate synthase n=1 Tax=Candidatus Termititenax dinenymphae TaxID=2218523 RepID=A0A388TLQ7_9BACT|nr:2-iminoacetate synthase [Candidatus Termititenax dinenymphae]